MKKLLLVAALGIAGLASAKGEVVKETTSEFKPLSKVVTLRYNWITVVSPCGSVYYLNSDDYTNDYDLWSDMYYFNAVKCDGDTGYPGNPLV